MQNQPNAVATPTARSRNGARAAAVRTLRIARNVLALLGVFFVFLLARGYSQYQQLMQSPELSTSAPSSSCASPRCM